MTVTKEYRLLEKKEDLKFALKTFMVGVICFFIGFAHIHADETVMGSLYIAAGLIPVLGSIYILKKVLEEATVFIVTE